MHVNFLKPDWRSQTSCFVKTNSPLHRKSITEYSFASYAYFFSHVIFKNVIIFFFRKEKNWSQEQVLLKLTFLHTEILYKTIWRKLSIYSIKTSSANPLIFYIFVFGFIFTSSLAFFPHFQISWCMWVVQE